MDISLLALGVGNSPLAIGVFTAGELQRVVRIPFTGSAGWAEGLNDELKRIGGAGDRPVVAASVNPRANPQIEEIVRTVSGQSVQWIGREIDIPIGVETQNPRETGIDRILNVAAAYEQMGKACVVVDAGTAVTVDCCNDNGDFLGGAIAPGVSMMLDALRGKNRGDRTGLVFPARRRGRRFDVRGGIAGRVLFHPGTRPGMSPKISRRSSANGRKSSPPAAMRNSYSRDGN